jgi:4-amino-4-deoxychorismate lyase
MAQYYCYQQDGALVRSDARMDERAFAYGDGFFSTIGVCDGQMICAPFHAKRILTGLSALRLSASVDELHDGIDAAC